jgi:hypothetical protein
MLLLLGGEAVSVYSVELASLPMSLLPRASDSGLKEQAKR